MGCYWSSHPYLLYLHRICSSFLSQGNVADHFAYFIFFFIQLVGHKSEVYEHNIKELELLKDQLDDTGDNMDAQNKNNIV